VISIIAAVAKNGVIGRDNALPWRLPADLAQFKQRTLDRTIVMGRKTFESLGRLLPRREHVVVTRDPEYRADGALVVHSIEEALARTGDVWVIGGAEIYRAALPRADRLVITHVDAEVEGDAHFPEVDWDDWRIVESESHAADEKHAYGFRVVVYERDAR
jgi:dihydrofolate reductase